MKKKLILRETDWFIAERSNKGVLISAKDRNARPRSRVVTLATWEQLEQMGDKEFDGSVVLDLGIGVFQK